MNPADVIGDRLPERIVRRIAVAESGCWLWTGAVTDGGYASATLDNRRVAGHRLTYETLVAPIPTGMCIDHLCRVRHCVNPDHLEVVTPAENSRRSPLIGKHNAAKTHCKYGHEYTPANTISRSFGWRRCRTCEQARDNRRTAAGGMSPADAIAAPSPVPPPAGDGAGTHPVFTDGGQFR